MTKVLTFAHGGRCGDFIFALKTVKAICERENAKARIFLTDHHEPVGWSKELARSLVPLADYQPFVESCRVGNPENVDFNLIDAEQDYNPAAFPEWHGKDWPGNCNIAKRYAVHFGIELDDKPWLEVPTTTRGLGFVFHAPLRRCTNFDALLSAATILTEDHKPALEGQWVGDEALAYKCADFLEMATLVGNAKLFLGAISSGNALAEALGKPRFVQVADGCDNVGPVTNLNGMSGEEIAELVRKSL